MSVLQTIPFRADHIAAMAIQPRQRMLADHFDADHFRHGENPMAFTGVIEGRLVGAAGILPQWPGRAVCWAVLGAAIRPRDFQAIHRRVRRALAAAHRAGYGRIETTVAADWPEAMRWATALGFAAEALMKRYAPGGDDAWLMVKFDERV